MWHFRSEVAFERVAWLKMKAMREELGNWGGSSGVLQERVGSV